VGRGEVIKQTKFEIQFVKISSLFGGQPPILPQRKKKVKHEKILFVFSSMVFYCND
jgi:hypothetical protein